MLSVLGGAIGLVLGVGGSIAVIQLINQWSPGTDWPVVVSFPAAVTAILFSGLVGIFFGF